MTQSTRADGVALSYVHDTLGRLTWTGTGESFGDAGCCVFSFRSRDFCNAED
ncbi:MAG TPA: hypothetical protein VJ806_06275 [Luteimonas sp.]|nr:hypothetical protein [Luteimonas sp.]